MGRYYSGDIEGKFWFGVQYSNAADRFGVAGCQPDELYYNYDKEDIDTVKEELDAIIKAIGNENIILLDTFFDQNSSYNNKIMGVYNSELPAIWEKHQSNYADYILGTKIYNHLLKNDYCEFTAEI